MIDKHLFSYLRYAHGLYNILVAGLFYYHGLIGLTIRRRRKSGAPLPLSAVRRHRKMGPVLVFMGVIGFLAGLTIASFDKGVLEYPLHLSIGGVIIISLITTYVISRNIKGPVSPLRTPHFILGITILCLYLIQLFLGLGILF